VSAADVSMTVACVRNLMVLRMGDGTTPLGPNAAALTLVEFRPTDGTVARSISVPSTGTNRLTLGCDQVLEGSLALSGNGRFITLAGYDADLGTANVRSTPAATVARAVGQLDLAGNFSVVARVNDGFDQDSLRTAATMDGTGYWLGGSGLNGTG